MSMLYTIYIRKAQAFPGVERKNAIAGSFSGKEKKEGATCSVSKRV
jgi:hypothetical protein